MNGLINDELKSNKFKNNSIKKFHFIKNIRKIYAKSF